MQWAAGYDAARSQSAFHSKYGGIEDSKTSKEPVQLSTVLGRWSGKCVFYYRSATTVFVAADFTCFFFFFQRLNLFIINLYQQGGSTHDGINTVYT